MNSETLTATADSDETVTAVTPEPVESATGDTPMVMEPPPLTGRHVKPTKPRAGFTTNKGHGTPKAKRRMAAQSRRRNRN